MRSAPPASPDATSAPLVVDAEGPEVRRLRSTLRVPAMDGVDLRGLDALSCSGSAQFSTEGWRTLQRELVAQGAGDVHVVDLRHEPHGFLNGVAVSWYARRNWGSVGLTAAEAAALEALKLRVLAHSETVLVARAEDVKRGRPVPAEPWRRVQVGSEEEILALPPGQYVRLPVLDHLGPDDGVLDRFVRLVRSLPAGAHLHFHCRGGKGRTSTFMALHDMLRSAAVVPLDVILERQRRLGDYDLCKRADPGDEKAPYIEERLELLGRFYAFARSGAESWPTWSSTTSEG